MMGKTKTMQQRTCNIIMCCKGHCKLVDDQATMQDAIITYMSAECACPKEYYTRHLVEQIVLEALYDYMNCADNPGFELRQIFHQYALADPPILERILTMFQLTKVRNDQGCVNGFTEGLIHQSDIDLSPKNTDGDSHDK